MYFIAIIFDFSFSMYPFDSNVCTIDMEGKTYKKWNSYNFLKDQIVYNLKTLNLGLNI